MTAAVSSAEPEKLFSYAGTLQPMDAAHVAYAAGLAQVLASFESSCTEYSVHVGHLADAMRSHGNRCDVTDGWVRSVGDKFVWADQSAVVPTPTPGGVAGMPREDFWEWLRELVETGQAVFGGLLVAASMHGGKGGQIVIDLPEWLRTVFGVSLRDAREWAGLPGHLNNIKPANLPGSMAKFGLVTSVPIIAYKWVEDFRAYEGSERVAAMVTDAALVLIPVGLSYAAGVGIAALAGLALFASVPAVVVGGAIVLAGVAVGVGFNWVADKWDLRDKAIGWVKGGLDWAGEQLDAAGDRLAETAEHGLAWVDDHVFKPVSDKITGFFEDMGDFARGLAQDMARTHATVIHELESIRPPDWKVVALTVSVTPSGASLSPVGDERPYWKQWLGDNTPFAFIPGFTPPAGGDIETIDDRLQQKFGRDVSLVDGDVQWSEYEAAAVDRAVQKLPRRLAEQSLIQNFYREESPGSNTLAYWLPPGYTGSGDDDHGPCTITFYLPHGIPRQGSMEAVERAETVLFHELVHSAQFNSDGSFTALTQDYLNEFGWTVDENWNWSNSIPKGQFPGSTDNYWGIPVAYPESGRNGVEDMAEAITYYAYEAETLKRESPERYQWIKDHVFEGQEF